MPIFTPDGAAALLPFIESGTMFQNPVNSLLISEVPTALSQSSGVVTTAAGLGAITPSQLSQYLNAVNQFTTTPSMPTIPDGGFSLFSTTDPASPYALGVDTHGAFFYLNPGAWVGSLGSMLIHTGTSTGQSMMNQIMGSLLNCAQFHVKYQLPFPPNIPPSSDPCLALVKQSLGSVLGPGGEQLGTILQIAAAVAIAYQNGELQRQINHYIQQLENIDQVLRGMVNSELFQMEECFKEAAYIAILGLIPNFFKTACMREIYNKVGAPDFVSELYKAIAKIPTIHI